MDFKRSSVHLARRTEVSTTSMSPCQNDLGTADFATHHCSSRAVALSSPAFSGVKLWQDIKQKSIFGRQILKDSKLSDRVSLSAVVAMLGESHPKHRRT